MKKFGPDPIFAAALMLVAGLTYAATTGAPARVDVVSPQGEARNVRQISARFTEPMVAFGDPRLADPFDLQCQGDPERLKGRGRWADPRNWIYDFESDLPAGQRCTLTLKSDVKTVAGQTLDGRREFTFHTGGPAVISSFPREGEDDVDEEQAFVLALDAKPDAGSLSDAWCEAAGINERIPLKLLSEKETNELLEANRNRAYNLFGVYMKGDRRMVPLALFKLEDKRWRDLPVVAVRCAQRVPAGDADHAAVQRGSAARRRAGHTVEERQGPHARARDFEAREERRLGHVQPAVPREGADDRRASAQFQGRRGT